MTVPFVLPGKYEAAKLVGMNPAHMDAVLSVLNIVDVQTVGGALANGTTDTGAIIADLDAMLVHRGGGSLAFSLGRYRVAASLEIDAATVFDPGAVLVPDHGVTVTFAGPLTAGLHQIVDVSKGGTIAFGAGSTPYAYPEWFGAFVSDVVNDPVIDAGIMPAWYASIESELGVKAKPVGYLSNGVYSYADQIVPLHPQVKIVGCGRRSSYLNYVGPESVAGVKQAAIKWSATTYSNPTLSDFSILSTGRGIDWTLLDAAIGQVYDGSLERMDFFCANQCLIGYALFSVSLKDLYGESLNEHIWQLNCESAFPLVNVWGQKCPANKAAYRLAGSPRLYSCNGVGAPSGYWAVVGSNPAGTDGFQNDFPGLTSYIDLACYGCNFEDWGVDVIYAVNLYQQIFIDGGAFVRGNALPNFQSVIHTIGQSLAANGAGFVHLRGVRNLIAAGVPTQDYLWQKGTNPGVLLENDVTGFTTYKSTDAGLSYNVGTQAVVRQNDTIMPAFNAVAFGGVKGARVTKTAALYQMTVQDFVVDADATSNNVQINLPFAPACAGSIVGVFRSDASAHTVTISGTIDGVANPTLAAQFKGYLVQSDGVQWRTLSKV